MPINYKRYGKNWKHISAATRERAGNKCELCFAPNGERVGRLGRDFTHPWDHLQNIDDCAVEFRVTKIVLTVHHIDGNIRNNSRHNLIALCQRCHLRLDMERNIKKRLARKIGGEQQEIFK